MADIITLIRGLCALTLLACPALSLAFYALYTAAWLTDAIDGAVARRTNTVSERGAMLDSAADIMLVVVSLIKLLPVLELPLWLLLWIAGIALIKAVNLASGYVLRKRFVALHTVMNKITGGLLFALPLTLPVLDLRISGAVVCAAATFAAVQEGHFIRTGRDGARNTDGMQRRVPKGDKMRTKIFICLCVAVLMLTGLSLTASINRKNSND